MYAVLIVHLQNTVQVLIHRIPEDIAVTHVCNQYTQLLFLSVGQIDDQLKDAIKLELRRTSAELHTLLEALANGFNGAIILEDDKRSVTRFSKEWR